MNRVLSSESVTAGHPDKVADQISDAVLDYALEGDPNSRVACETMVTTGLVVVAGEITTSTYLDIPRIARDKILEIGYDDADKGFDGNSCAVILTIDEQSPDIAQGVDRAGAGDQGMMFGYATSETDSMLPLPIEAAHYITRKLQTLRESLNADVLRPDGKAQVSVVYDYSGTAPYIETIVVSAQHSPTKTQKDIENIVHYQLMKDFPYKVAPSVKYFINPTGRFVRGGPHADAGLTGRKIIVDTYGGIGRHGGGAFSGKDPSKVDRSGSYAARQLAKAIVYSGEARRAEVQLAYAIGVAEPVSVYVELDTWDNEEEQVFAKKIIANVDLTPQGIIDRLGLIEFGQAHGYQRTATYGHFTDPSYPWESEEGIKQLLDVIYA